MLTWRFLLHTSSCWFFMGPLLIHPPTQNWISPFFNCSLLRNSRKILTLPSIDSNSSDHVFSKVLLFSPDAQEEMDVKLLRDLYTKYDEPPVKDVFGNDQTMIDRIERWVYGNFQVNNSPLYMSWVASMFWVGCLILNCERL